MDTANGLVAYLIIGHNEYCIMLRVQSRSGRNVAWKSLPAWSVDTCVKSSCFPNGTGIDLFGNGEDESSLDTEKMGTGETADSKRITISLLGTQLVEAEKESILIMGLGAIRYRDAWYIRFNGADVWLFEYGVLVSWNQSENDRQQLVFRLKGLIQDYFRRPPIEQYAYHVDPASDFGIHDDLLVVPQQDTLSSLALSHAFAQAAKLEFFEDKAWQVIQQNAHISRQLARTGKVPLSRRNLAKLRGILFDTGSDITLHYNLLDTPEFFWNYPELEPQYQKLAKYLDLTPRVEILNRKLATIEGLLSMLASEQYHKHSAFLEWIIIVLIAVEILLYFLK